MLNFHEFLHTMYICAKFCCKNAMMFAKYFEYYTIILRGGRFFVDTLYIVIIVAYVNINCIILQKYCEN